MIGTEEGASVPVTVIEIAPNWVTQIKTQDNDGYRALQVATGKANSKRVTKAMSGHFAKAKVEAQRTVLEFPLDKDEGSDITVGSQIKVDIFQIKVYNNDKCSQLKKMRIIIYSNI